jgi:hypothetical protein
VTTQRLEFSSLVFRTLKFGVWCSFVLLSWLAILAGVAFIAPAGTPMIVFSPGHAMDVALRGGGSLEQIGASLAVTRSADSRYVHSLYHAGAWVVIDARVLQSCRSLFR